MLWDEMNVEKTLLDYPNDYSTIYLIKHKPDLSFYDITSTGEKEDLKTLINRSFHEGAAKIEAWEKEKGKPAQWADYKDTYVQHLLRMAPLSEHVRVGGNSGIVNAAGPRNAPSWRMVVSLEKTGVKAWAVYPGGQSGNPGSRFYANMLDYWATGQYYKLNFPGAPADMGGKSINNTQLTPVKK
jgi:penicillin amidase